MGQSEMDLLLKRITYNPGIFGGKAIIRGMQFRVVDLFGVAGKWHDMERNFRRFSIPGSRRYSGVLV